MDIYIFHKIIIHSKGSLKVAYALPSLCQFCSKYSEMLKVSVQSLLNSSVFTIASFTIASFTIASFTIALSEVRQSEGTCLFVSAVHFAPYLAGLSSMMLI